MNYIWLCCVFLLLVLNLIFPFNVCAEFGYSKNASKKRLTVWLNGFSLYKNEFEKAKNLPESKVKKIEQENTDSGFAMFMDKLRFYDTIYTELKQDIEKFLVYFQKKLQIPKYIMHLDFGFQDAANTGVAAGAAYALVFGFSALIYNYLNLKKKDFDVYVIPHFQETRIDFYFKGIFRLRFVHIIRALFMLLNIYKKFKKIKNNKGGVLV